MWMLVMFDLPVVTKNEMKDASNFRKYLMDQGFDMTQYSVYMRSCTGKEHTERLTELIKAHIPKKGKVDILYFTDKQYENIVTFRGQNRHQRSNPDQYILFQPDISSFLPEQQN